MKKQQSSFNSLSKDEFDVLYFLKRNSIEDIQKVNENLSNEIIQLTVDKLKEKKFLDQDGDITPLGINALLP